MINSDYIEWIGYLAMVLLMISFSLKDIKKLRIWNSFGCGVFIIYGVFLNQPPIIFTNVFILLVNLYYLFIKKK